MDACSIPLMAVGQNTEQRTSGTLVGLEGIAPSRNLEFLPYFLPGITQVKDDDSILQTTTRIQTRFRCKIRHHLKSHPPTSPITPTSHKLKQMRNRSISPDSVSFFLRSVPSFWRGQGSSILGFHGRVRVDRHRCCFSIADRLVLPKGNAIPIIFGGKASGKVRFLWGRIS